MPSARARIAVWEVGPALGGDEGDDLLRGPAARCRPGPGRPATSTKGSGRRGSRASGNSGQDGDDAVAHVLDVTGALGRSLGDSSMEARVLGLHGALRNRAPLAHCGLRRRGQGGVSSHLRGGLQERARLGLGLIADSSRPFLTCCRQRDALTPSRHHDWVRGSRSRRLRNGEVPSWHDRGHARPGLTPMPDRVVEVVADAVMWCSSSETGGDHCIVPQCGPERDVSARE